MAKGVYPRKPRGPLSEKTKAKISARLKNNPNLQNAMKEVHARRLADGSDEQIRQKIRQTRIARGDWLDCDPTEFDKYKKIVRSVTSKQPIDTLENASKRGRNSYHLDHIVSKKSGFEYRLPPWMIGDISNLRFITEHENCSKMGWNTDEEVSALWFHLSDVLEF